VKPEESSAHEEGERDEEETSIAAAVRRLTRREGKDAVHEGDAENEPEVSRVVLPLNVERRLPEEKPKAEEWKGDKDGP
jgi:hypothetical protein